MGDVGAPELLHVLDVEETHSLARNSLLRLDLSLLGSHSAASWYSSLQMYTTAYYQLLHADAAVVADPFLHIG